MPISPERDVSYPNRFFVGALINDANNASKKLAHKRHCTHRESDKLKYKCFREMSVVRGAGMAELVSRPLAEPKVRGSNPSANNRNCLENFFS
jgi:hypothetical protein